MKSKKRGRLFTLVELLVVIAVISILASLLLPALSTAKGHVKRISCAGNLRNVGQATYMYVSDNSSWLPPACWAGFATYYLNQYLNAPYLEVKAQTDAAHGGYNSLAFAKMAGVFFCPAVESPASPFYTPSGPVSSFYSTYNATLQQGTVNCNGGAWALNDGSSLRRLDNVYGNCALALDRLYTGTSYPSAALSLAGVYTSLWQYSDASDYPQWAPAFVHLNLCNFLFKDGHVQAIKYTGKTLFDNNYILK